MHAFLRMKSKAVRSVRSDTFTDGLAEGECTDGTAVEDTCWELHILYTLGLPLWPLPNFGYHLGHIHIFGLFRRKSCRNLGDVPNQFREKTLVLLKCVSAHTVKWRRKLPPPHSCNQHSPRLSISGEEEERGQEPDPKRTLTSCLVDLLCNRLRCRDALLR